MCIVKFILCQDYFRRALARLITSLAILKILTLGSIFAPYVVHLLRMSFKSLVYRLLNGNVKYNAYKLS